MTSRELVDAVDAACVGLDPAGVRTFLATLGLDPLDFVRARANVKRGRPDAPW